MNRLAQTTINLPGRAATVQTIGAHFEKDKSDTQTHTLTTKAHVAVGNLFTQVLAAGTTPARTPSRITAICCTDDQIKRKIN